jgi:drug efflux transport system ATP-binding protein
VADPVIEIQDVVKRFAAGSRPVTALDRLSARIEAGRITGLVGPDGAGKTTLMRLVAGLLRPDGGTVTVLGHDSMRDAPAIQAAVGYMPQRFGLYEDLSVAENLALYADLHGLSRSARAARFDELMHFTGLRPFSARLAGQLSGGMKQKLGLACTLVHPPALLLLDEPSVGVDPVSRRELWSIVRSLAGLGITVLWSTAYLDEAERCDDVLLLKGGRLLGAGAPKTFSARVEGRTFVVRTGAADRRAVLRRVAVLDKVTDAIVKGADVRVLVAGDAPDGYLAQRLAETGQKDVRVEPAAPVFEDAFIALLRDSAEGPAMVDPPSPPPPPPPPPSQDGMGAPAASGAVIAVEKLVRRFGTFTAVDGIDFTVTRGEIFGLLGPNGAGKSTTFKMLCGLLPPSEGKAQVLGIDLRHASAVARGRIGYMAQKFSLYGNMSVMQNLRFFARAYGLTGAARRRMIETELADFALAPYADTVSDTLPLGYKQRLALACAIMHAPGVLFLDEPTSGVDPLVRRDFWTRINAMAAAGVTVLVTTHFMEEAEYCDRIGIIYRGRLVASGTPDRLKADHSTPERPQPTLEDAFIDLIEHYDRENPL